VHRVSVEELARSPVDGYVAGETFAHFCVRPGLWGVLLWGHPGESHACELGRSLVAELAPPAEPHVSIVDASRLEIGAFRLAEAYLARYREALAVAVQKIALVRPAVAGAYDVLPRPYPVGVFHDAVAALTWLDVADPHADAELVASIHREATGTPRDVGALRAFLDKHLHGTSVGCAAKQLAMSERTLQRKLGVAGTSFKDELADARIRAAKVMLLESDVPLTSIAVDVGYSSLQVFSAMFRRRAGVSPSEFRRKRGG
jgi:AraC-like DNA-binding protein